MGYIRIPKLVSGNAIFIRPNLTANGTMGGNEFAVDSSTPSADYDAWKAVDGSMTTRWRVTGTGNYYTFYNPQPLRVSSIMLIWNSNTNSYQAGDITVYGSNDGTTWTQLAFMAKPASADNPAIRTIMVNSPEYYKYHKMEMDPWGSAGAVDIKDIQINALYRP